MFKEDYNLFIAVIPNKINKNKIKRTKIKNNKIIKNKIKITKNKIKIKKNNKINKLIIVNSEQFINLINLLYKKILKLYRNNPVINLNKKLN